MYSRTIKNFVAAACILLGGIASAQAAIITVSTSDGLVSPGRDNQGFWLVDEANANLTNDNYFTREAGSFMHRSYFSFDLSSVTGNVTGAILELRRYSTDSNATLEFFDVSTSATDLAQRGIIDNSIHADLGSGVSYGSFAAGPGSPSDVMSFSLNPSAFADIDSAFGGYFSIGVTSTGGTSFSASGDEPGNGGPGYTQQLVLVTEETTAIGEPGTLAILGLGLVGLRLARRKRMI